MEEFEKDLPIDSLTEMKAMPESDFIRNFRDARSRGTLMAEGDSWFDYPWKDVLSCLEDEHGYDVESVAHKGIMLNIWVNLRGTLRDDLSVYQEDWANELHPSSAGFSLVSNRFAEEINLLP